MYVLGGGVALGEGRSGNERNAKISEKCEKILHSLKNSEKYNTLANNVGAMRPWCDAQ